MPPLSADILQSYVECATVDVVLVYDEGADEDMVRARPDAPFRLRRVPRNLPIADGDLTGLFTYDDSGGAVIARSVPGRGADRGRPAA